MKVICFGVRAVEKPIFEKFNKNFGYELELRSESLSAENVDILKGFDAVICRASDKIDAQVVARAKELGVKFILTRTVGFDHMDVEALHAHNILSARVPSYSPTAISELAVSMALTLSRKSIYFAAKAAANLDYTITPHGFAKEIKNSVVGIIGTGKIGFEAAKMFRGLGATVVGYDPYPNDKAKTVLTYLPLDELLAKADIISVHVPYIKGQNDKFINAEFLSKMKQGSILVNTARGQLQDEAAILAAVKSGKLAGVGLDVFNNEKQFFGKKLDAINDPVIEELISLFPTVMTSPHIGSYTDEAVANMVEISYQNLKELANGQECKNKL
ncbi:NAD(P)-dependent oxidoreductase [Mycoplasmopsis columbinasalis]|uniref:D-lactate dehydrogenase n=1 Tax=Mycoplasmopsis columbinasalis TaxID=114880 RepID=A0A449BAV4_9BACT|nr:NAD(P)-dependent oxidoreductase [Mycoplasmopsis columbinasalis]VEU78308.1 D-lactate dehydrogenase [Mycoplasmopsis columbinasalis]